MSLPSTLWYVALPGVMVALLSILLIALTRGSPLRPVAWVAVLGLTTYVALKALRLDLLAGLLESFTLFASIIVAILFRDEIRTFLLAAGRRIEGLVPFATGSAMEGQGRLASEVAVALESLRESSSGGLIVIEREDSLEHLEETGFVVNAALTGYLIEAIFRSRSPIHDGAVLIRRGRLAAGGVVLPLFRGSHPLLVRHGTRHRAALGLAAQSDALVIVLSEETGKIHMAENGRMHRVQREAVRREILGRLPEVKPEPHPGVLGLLVAGFLWMYARLPRYPWRKNQPET